MNLTDTAGDIRERRLAAGLTQRALAERAGCSSEAIRLFDRGYVPGRSETRLRVLEVLDELEHGAPLEAA